MHNILLFIENFKKKYKNELEELFLNEFCYYFAIILDERYSHQGTIMYIPKYNYFCYKIYNDLYDINGLIDDEEKIKLSVSWAEYKKQNDTDDIIKDYILQK